MGGVVIIHLMKPELIDLAVQGSELSEGVAHVLVNGVIVMRDSRTVPDALPGRPALGTYFVGASGVSLQDLGAAISDHPVIARLHHPDSDLEP
jgi:hypothetical protein